MKEAYLTIDDSPSKDFRKKVNYLYKNKIPAIFFCVGKNIEERPKDLIYAIKKGFVIGNHSYSHKRFSSLSEQQYKDEINKTEKLIESLYKKARIKRPIKIFRFPFGDKGSGLLVSLKQIKVLRHVFRKFKTRKEKKIQEFLKSQKFKQPGFKKITYNYFSEYGLDKDTDTFWTLDFQEYFLPGSVAIKKSKHMFKSSSREILLIHDHENTTKSFFKIIDFLLRNKVKFMEITCL